MDVIIFFFRDILDGPAYIVLCVICGILICSCIGYMCEKALNKRKQKENYESSHVKVDNPIVNNNQSVVGQSVTNVVQVNDQISQQVGIQGQSQILQQVQTVQQPQVMQQNVQPVQQVDQVQNK